MRPAISGVRALSRRLGETQVNAQYMIDPKRTWVFVPPNLQATFPHSLLRTSADLRALVAIPPRQTGSGKGRGKGRRRENRIRVVVKFTYHEIRVRREREREREREGGGSVQSEKSKSESEGNVQRVIS